MVATSTAASASAASTAAATQSNTRIFFFCDVAIGNSLRSKKKKNYVRPMVLVPDNTVHCSRPPARNLHLSSSESATCKPFPMVLVPDSTVHCSRPPARNLHLSSSDHALGPWVGFMYILPCYASHMIPGTYVSGT